MRGGTEEKESKFIKKKKENYVKERRYENQKSVILFSTAKSM